MLRHLSQLLSAWTCSTQHIALAVLLYKLYVFPERLQLPFLRRARAHWCTGEGQYHQTSSLCVSPAPSHVFFVCLHRPALQRMAVQRLCKADCHHHCCARLLLPLPGPGGQLAVKPPEALPRCFWSSRFWVCYVSVWKATLLSSCCVSRGMCLLLPSGPQ